MNENMDYGDVGTQYKHVAEKNVEEMVSELSGLLEPRKVEVSQESMPHHGEHYGTDAGQVVNVEVYGEDVDGGKYVRRRKVPGVMGEKKFMADYSGVEDELIDLETGEDVYWD